MSRYSRRSWPSCAQKRSRDERLAVLRQAADVHWLTCDQIVRVLPLFEWRADRVRVVEVTVQAIADPPNVGRIVATFESVDRSRVRAVLGLNE